MLAQRCRSFQKMSPNEWRRDDRTLATYRSARHIYHKEGFSLPYLQIDFKEVNKGLCCNFQNEWMVISKGA